MATADEYADWIVRNADKKGTPDFETVAQAYQLAKQEETNAATPQPQPDSVGRQAGLFLRSAARGLAGIPQIITEPVRRFIVNTSLDAAGLPRAQSLTDASDTAANAIGLPAPQNSAERVVDKSVELGIGAGGMSSGAGKIAELLRSYAPTLYKGILAGADAFAQAPMVQAVSGAAGGAAGQHAKETGAGALGQIGSTIVGSLLGAGGAAGIKAGVDAVTNWAKSAKATPEAVDQTIRLILENQGIDPASIGPAVLSGMREHVRRAMNTGSLDEAAVGRLADYARVGATPTRGPITLDPFDVTMQQNASKIAAATGSRDAKLPQIAQDNNRKLIESLVTLGPSEDASGLGAQLIGGVRNTDDALTANKTALYSAAREMAGGDIPLQRAPFIDAVTQALVKENKLAFLPEPVSKMLNTISKGQIVIDGQTHEVPFNASTLDNLKTTIATAMRSADGNGRAALSLARNALDSVPMSPVKAEFGGAQLVTPEGASFLSAADAQPAQIMDALNKARASAARQFQWRESAPGIAKAVDESANPLTFVRDNVISSAASPSDVAALLKASGSAGNDAARSGVAQHLLDAAIGAGAKPDTGNFSGRSLERALRSIGDAKLKLLFDAEEIETLKSAARVGTYETHQPRGAAVNNSNTGAAVARMLDTLGRYIKPIAKALPFGEMAVTGPLDFVTMKAAERPAMQIVPGLLAPGSAPASGSFSAGLLAPTVYGAGLLSAGDR